MRATSLLASATVIGVASKGVRAFQYPVSRSLTKLVGAGSYASAVPTLNKISGPIHLKRDGVRRYLWNSIFNAAGKGDGIDYSTLTGMESKEAAELALKGVVQDKSKDGYEIATFAGGCFWGLELAYQRVVGVIDTSVGYTQGKDEKPTYDYVCSGMSGHTEAVQVFFDPKEVSYEYLCKLLLTRINPTLKNQVGNDRGAFSIRSTNAAERCLPSNRRTPCFVNLSIFSPKSFNFLSVLLQGHNTDTASITTTKGRRRWQRKFSKKPRRNLASRSLQSASPPLCIGLQRNTIRSTWRKVGDFQQGSRRQKGALILSDAMGRWDNKTESRGERGRREIFFLGKVDVGSVETSYSMNECDCETSEMLARASTRATAKRVPLLWV